MISSITEIFPKELYLKYIYVYNINFQKEHKKIAKKIKRMRLINFKQLFYIRRLRTNSSCIQVEIRCTRQEATR